MTLKTIMCFKKYSESVIPMYYLKFSPTFYSDLLSFLFTPNQSFNKYKMKTKSLT